MEAAILVIVLFGSVAGSLAMSAYYITHCQV
jgi:hypothetical protein